MELNKLGEVLRDLPLITQIVFAYAVGCQTFEIDFQTALHDDLGHARGGRREWSLPRLVYGIIVGSVLDQCRDDRVESVEVRHGSLVAHYQVQGTVAKLVDCVHLRQKKTTKAAWES